jgi:O-antigen/teichoic acid export membrane protein
MTAAAPIRWSRLLRLDPSRLLPIALSQVVGLACGIAGVKITSQLIAPSDYGTYGLFLSCAPLGMWVIHAGLLKFVSRHWADSPDRQSLLREIFRAGAGKLPWLALATLAATLLLLPAHWLPGWPLLFAAAALLSFAAFAQISLQAVRRHWADFTVSAAGSLTRTLLPPLLYVTTSHTLSALFTGFVGHTLTLALVGLWFVRKENHLAPATPVAAPRQLESVYEGHLFIALSVASWTLTAVNRWIVAGFFGADAAGFFTLAASLTIIVASMPGTIFIQYAQPGLFAAPSITLDDRHALARRIDRIALAYTLLALCGVFALRLLSPWLIGPFIAEAYRDSLPFILGAGCFAIAATAAQFYHVLLLAGKRERACGPVDLSTAAILIAGGVISAAAGESWFTHWLTVTPLIPWLLTRPLARRYLLRGP